MMTLRKEPRVLAEELKPPRQNGFASFSVTAARIGGCSGNSPVASLEWIFTPSSRTSKQPPREGISVSASSFVFARSRMAALRPSACGSYPQSEQYSIVIVMFPSPHVRGVFAIVGRKSLSPSARIRESARA